MMYFGADFLTNLEHFNFVNFGYLQGMSCFNFFPSFSLEGRTNIWFDYKSSLSLIIFNFTSYFGQKSLLAN